MDSQILSLAERIIGRCDAAHPADAVLRLELKAQRSLAPRAAGEVSRAVFTYFRWHGWLEETTGLAQRIEKAATLAAEFERTPRAFPDSELIARCVPAWIRSEIQCTPEFARMLQTETKLWLRARPGHGSLLAQGLGDCRAFGQGNLSDILEYQGTKDLFRVPEFHSGAFELQDLSSQAVGLVCAPLPGQTWWDVCAGEGGKLLHLSDLMQNKGLIWATDRAEWRLRRLKRRAARAKVFNYRAVAWEGGPKLPTRTRFDGVLVDAPCSGTGTWQRNPHARWTLTAGDLAELAGLQLRLLACAAKAVKPGGKLIYSVCSLAQAETSKVAEGFDARFPEFTRGLVENPLVPGASPERQLFLWPQQFGGNGMFIAAWSRKSP